MKKKLNSVLLIDDDEATNFINEIIIKEVDESIRIWASQTAKEALNLLNSSQQDTVNEGSAIKPDLIFLDINMPGLSGWDFLDEYKKLPIKDKEKIVIIMLTNSFNPDDKKRAMSIREVAEFENKALTSDMVSKVVEKYFTRSV